MAKNKKSSTAAKPKTGNKPATGKKRSSAAVKRQPKPAAAPKPSPNPQTQSSTVLQSLRHFAGSPGFAKIFAAFSLAVLLCTTLFWSVLTARLHQSNADQLIDAYLFESWDTFQGAMFPGAHSFLLKWPIFWLMSLFGNTALVYMASTIAMAGAAVGFLAYLLYRIERRLLVFGLLCLALSSVLLLVPAQPYPGALLPVNMAMTTTRNLEYVVFIIALILALRVTRLKSWLFAGVVVLLALVITSDKLFLVPAAGAGLVMALWPVWTLRKSRLKGLTALATAGRLLLALVFALVVATGLLLLLNRLGLTHIGSGQSASPFSLIDSPRQLGIGVVYGAAALLTNLGANPVHGTIVMQEIPRAVLESLQHFSALPYVVNLVIASAGLYAGARLLTGRQATDTPGNGADIWTRLAILLTGSTLAMVAVFVLTDHYYPVDARYLTIGLFALFVAAAAYWRGRPARPLYIVSAAAIIIAVLPIGLMVSWQEYLSSEQAMAGRTHMTARVSDELQRRKIDRLVGNYWDITVVKAKNSRPVTISPVDKCTLPRPILNSNAWFKLPPRTSTAYLAVRDGSPGAGPDSVAAQPGLVTYGGCSLARVVGEYGVPSERVPIGGTSGPEQTPDILLLLYPDGTKRPTGHASEQTSQKPGPKTVAAKKAAEPPVIPELLPFTERAVCTAGTTLQVVAHQDDDILFMNPDLLGSVIAGRCNRTVYLTAGDAGEDIKYWGSREQGAKAAYAQMYAMPNEWQDEQQLLAGRPVTVSYLHNVPEVSLVFLRLPDGNMHGEGFIAHNHESIHGLLAGATSEIHPVDGSPAYTRQLLLDGLQDIMTKDQPNQIRTLGTDDVNDGDHADHHDAGILTLEASRNYLQQHELVRYIGYPEKGLPVNLSDDDITRKLSSFLAYAKFDGAVCQTVYECQNTVTYGSYLTRQYPQIPAAPPM